MTSTHLFDARVAALRECLSVFVGGKGPITTRPLPIADRPWLTSLQPRLRRELEDLESAAAQERTDSAGELALIEWLSRRSVDEARAALAEDPVHRLATGPHRRPTVTDTEWKALGNIVFGPGTPVTTVITAIGPAATGVLLATARAQRLAQPAEARPALWRDVAVMMPLRLETKFDADPAGTTTMRLRIIPDEASVLRHDPDPTATEIELLQAFWQHLHDSLDEAVRALPVSTWPAHEKYALAPWEALCHQVGGARAAWLAGTFATTVDGGVVTVTPEKPPVDHDVPPNRVGGLPETIGIWCEFTGSEPRLIATTAPIDTSALVLDAFAAGGIDGDHFADEDRWWMSFDAACQAGLGVTCTLPDGATPSDISAIYAVGIGASDPADHFAQLADSGELARVALGTATNAVDGAATTDLGSDPEGWYQLMRRRLDGGYGEGDLASALTGRPDGFGPVPGNSGPTGLDRLLVTCAWPTLWGHHFRDLWGFGDDSDALGIWAMDNLAPQGPIPPIRIAEQPYGILPTSTMGRWQVDTDEPDGRCEPDIRDVLWELRSRAIDAVRSQDHPTVVGATTEQFMELIGADGVSHAYTYRPFLSPGHWANLYTTVGLDPSGIADRAGELYASAGKAYLGRQVAIPLLGTADFNELTLPLVVPTQWPEWEDLSWERDDQGHRVLPIPVGEAMARIVEEIARFGSRAPVMWGRQGGERQFMPDSLLVRILWQSLMHAQRNSATATAQSQARLIAETLPRSFGELSHELATPGIIPDVERALRATLDTATHRIDPWFTAMAARRLRILAGAPSTRYRLGAFGWVDGPIRPATRTTSPGLVHAPSHAQALTAAILRDAAVSSATEDPTDADRWSMRLDSARVRLAGEIADDVRIGCHPFEAIGRQVERVIADQDDIKQVRGKFPMRRGREDAATVCHGPAALAGLLNPPGSVPPIPMSDSRRGGLEALRQALDAYADLLIAEGVHQVVCSRPDAAGAVMDAAAGLAPPPTLNSIRTPLTAHPLRTTVLSIVPVGQPGSPSPATLADPSVAAALESRIGAAEAWTWTADDRQPPRAVSLLDLGLSPIDATLLSSETLAGLAACRLGVDEVAEHSSGVQMHRRARDFVTSLGGPAFFSEIVSDTTNADADVISALDAEIIEDLLGRYTALRAAATTASAELAEAITGDRRAQGAALFTALLWGVVPHTDSDVTASVRAVTLGVEPPAGSTIIDDAALAELVDQARSALGNRIATAPTLPAPGPGRDLPRADESLATAISELASPEGTLAVLSTVSVQNLLALGELVRTPDHDLDDWLATVAAVRPHMARIEAAQFEPAPALSIAWSNAPQDHWQTKALAEFIDQQHHLTQPGGMIKRFVAAFSTAEVTLDGLADRRLAVGLVDSWTESAPRSRQTTTAAFGFDAPGARAPQAILIAVPPSLGSFGAEFDEQQLVEVVADTRLGVHARAARIQDMGDYQAAIGTAMIAARGQLGHGISLDIDTSFHLPA